MSARRWGRLALLAALLLGAGVEAQHGPLKPPLTGRLETRNFVILHTENSAGWAYRLGPELETARESFTRALGRQWPGVTEVRVAANRAEMARLTPGGIPPPSWAAAVAYPSLNLVVLEGQALAEDAGRLTLRHELSHVALGQLASGWPRWFQEGLAMHLSGERFSVSLYTTLFRAVRKDEIFPFADLRDRWPTREANVEIAYAQSEAFVAFLISRHGPEGMASVLDEVIAGARFELAFARALRTSVRLEEDAFRDSLPSRYSWLPVSVVISLFWVLAALLCVLGYLVIRIRRARRAKVPEWPTDDLGGEWRLPSPSVAQGPAEGSDPDGEPQTPSLPRLLH